MSTPRHIRRHDSALRRLRAAGGAALLLCSPAWAETAPDDPALKAEMIYNIAKFVEWPGKALQGTDGQIVFAIFGLDDFAEALAGTLSTKTISGRPVFVMFVRRVQDVKNSHIVFVAASEFRRIPELVETLGRSSVLTVADSQDFIAQGGMVSLTHDQDHLRFEINRARAERAGLKISAKLLALSRVVAPPN